MSTTMPRRAKTLCGVELGEPEATALAVANLAAYRSNGCKVRLGWDSRAPYPNGCLRFHFLDHLYRVVNSEGIKTYGAEPYGLEQRDLIELGRLATTHWHIWIGEYPLWYPGRTTPILMRREAQ